MALAALSAAAIWIFHAWGSLLLYGDAEAHLNIARRIVDSQTPGYAQVGVVWLPLPHWLMLPFVRVDAWWRSGIAGAIPAALCFVAGGAFLYFAVRRLFDSPAAAAAATALFALNPNLLYLQSIPMTEPVFFAGLLALLYFSVRFRQTQGWLAAGGAGIATSAAALARYEGWFLIPFAAAYFLLAAKRRRFQVACLFGILAALGPLFWLAHNWWVAGDVMASFTGPYSAKAQMGNAGHPGKHDLRTAFLYFRTGAQLCASPWLAWLALAGAVAGLFKRVFWPPVLLALPGVFYLWAIYRSNTFIYVPTLWPYSYDAVRYTMAVFPLLAMTPAALVALAPPRARAAAALLVIAAGSAWWLVHPRPSAWVVFEEARVNSVTRCAFVREAAQYLAPRYVPGSGIITSFGDLTAIFRESGIPLRETFIQDNGVPWEATLHSPELLLWQEWAVAMEGDPVHEAVGRAAQYGIRYTLEKYIEVKGAPAVEIYRRTGGPHGRT